MANLKDIRTRIASVKSTRQITSAMKMVSAAKLKRSQDAVINLRPYASKLHGILTHISQSIEGSIENIYARENEVKKVLIIPVSSNKGLCGAFNANVIKLAVEQAENEFADYQEEDELYFLTIGKKVSEFFKSRKEYKHIGSEIDLLDKLSFDNANELIEKIMGSYVNKEYDKIILVYNKFKNAAVQQLTSQQFLPVKIDTAEKDHKIHHNYIFEPSKEEIVRDLIPKSLKIEFYEALLESVAAEHGARMTAMHKATDNASDLLKELQIYYNKARQASITNEILEIVSGAEALNK